MIENVPAPKVTNALLRCVRQDSLAQPLFECVNPESGLWVWEIPLAYGLAWDRWLDQTCQLLSSRALFLSTLCSGSHDYTLFVEVADATRPLRFSRSLLSVAMSAGFEIEVYCAGE